MSSEAGEAEEKSAATPPLNHAADKEDDPISALYSQQARFEQGSPSTGDSAANRAKQFLAKKERRPSKASDQFLLTGSALMML